AAVVGDAVDGQERLVQSLDGRPALARVGVIRADADLQQRAHELDLVAHRFEEELLEEVAGFVELAAVEMVDRRPKTPVVFQLHVARCRWPGWQRATGNWQHAPAMLRALAVIILLLGNLVLWGTPVVLGGIVKFAVQMTAPRSRLRTRVILALAWLAERWVG